MSGIYQQGPGETQRDTTLRDLLGVIFRRKWVVISAFVAATLLVGVRTALTPVTYSADAVLLLNRAGARASMLTTNGRVLPWVEVVESELEVLRSIPVLRGARELLRTGLDSPEDTLTISVGALASSVDAGVIGESNAIYVTASARDPKAAILMANAVARSYVSYHEEFFKLPDPRAGMQASADSIYTALSELQNRRSAIYEQLGLTDVTNEQKALAGRRQELAADLDKLDRQYAVLKTQLEDARAFIDNAAETIPFLENTGSVQGAGLVESLRNLVAKRRELERMRQKYTEKHPEVESLREDIEQLEGMVQDGVANIVATKEHEIRANRSEAATLRRQLDSVKDRLAQIPALAREVELLDTKIEAASRQYATLSDKIVDTGISSEGYADYSVRLLSPATRAERKARGDMVRIALVPILALVGGVGLAFYLENLDHSVRSREDLERHLEIPVLASFPDAPIEEGGSGGGPPPVSRVPFSGKRSSGA